MADVFSKEKRSDVMRRITSCNTKPELILRKILWQLGVRGWRVHPKAVPGRPDLAFIRYKLAIFVDGCFWHGCSTCYKRPKTNQTYWDSKKQRNIDRDKRNEAKLSELGWKILRFWEHEVERSSVCCAKTVISTLESLQDSQTKEKNGKTCLLEHQKTQADFEIQTLKQCTD